MLLYNSTKFHGLQAQHKDFVMRVATGPPPAIYDLKSPAFVGLTINMGIMYVQVAGCLIRPEKAIGQTRDRKGGSNISANHGCGFGPFCILIGYAKKLAYQLISVTFLRKDYESRRVNNSYVVVFVRNSFQKGGRKVIRLYSHFNAQCLRGGGCYGLSPRRGGCHEALVGDEQGLVCIY